MPRAYSVLEVKAIDEEKRQLTGIATTPATDRVDDIVEPKGAQFKLPIPFLWQHNHDEPIGHVTAAKVTSAGIEVTVDLVQIEEEGKLKDRLDEAWQSIKSKLVRGLSIGFAPIESANIDGTWGRRYIKWEWLELSAVTVPANAEATITSIKSIDTQQRAASGIREKSVVRLNAPAGASATVVKSIKTPKPEEGKEMNVKEQIAAFKATREQKSARMAEIMTKAGDEGRTLDAAETEEYDTLVSEVNATTEHLKRLEAMEKSLAANAVAVPATPGAPGQKAVAIAKNTQKLEPGIEFARFAMCLGAAKGDLNTAKAIAENRFPDNERIHVSLKAAVAAGTTTDATWAAPLVEYNQFAGDFVEFLRPQTIIGKFGVGNIPALRPIPFNVHVRGQTSGGAGYWVGQGAPKPLTKFDFNDAYLGFTKVANIAVLTEELMRFSNPSAERLVRDSLAGALIERLDTDFIDPAFAGSANVSPASITNGVTPVISSGTDADAIRVDVGAAMSKFITANITPTAGVWIMSATTALSLSLMRNALGQKEFPDITMLGGTFEGLPVIVSEYVGGDSTGRYVILANASDIWLADDGSVMIEASREASLQMLDNPTNNSTTGTPTSMVSMFQTNSVAIRAERYINWKKRRAAAVTYISGVNWGA